MELPFTSLKTFEEGFLLHFNYYKEIFPNAREVDFLNELKRKYLFWTKIIDGKRVFNDLIWTIEFSYPERNGFSADDVDITISTFAYVVDNYFKHYIPSIGNPFEYFPYSPFDGDDKFTKDYIGNKVNDPIEHLFFLIESDKKENNDFKKPEDYKPIHKKYLLDKLYHLDYFDFLYYENNEVKANENKFKDFGFAVLSIIDEIEMRIRHFTKQQIEHKNSIENNSKDADEKTQNKYSVPQIIKILDKLNIKGMMGEKGFTDFQTIQLLADIFGRTEKSIRNNFDNQNHTTTAENYISELKNLKAKR
ncbi:MAG: hypothetical protein E2590_09295 [Chryseobacterium sp.]|nr:hypothetical protein [Chryseobacterium sp.]